MSRPFEVQWERKCTSCGDIVEEGEEAMFDDNGDFIGMDCCGDAEDDADDYEAWGR